MLFASASFACSEPAIIYCHPGFGPPSRYLMADLRTYQRAGFEIWMVVFGEEEGLAYSASDDIERTKTLAEWLVTEGHEVYLVGVSRGAYVALETFGRYPSLFRKMVGYIPPIAYIDFTTTGNTPEEIERQRIYFDEVDNPLDLALMGAYDGLGDRILLLGGRYDRKCPPVSNILPFVEIVGCPFKLFWGSHSMSNSMARMGLQFMSTPANLPELSHIW